MEAKERGKGGAASSERRVVSGEVERLMQRDPPTTTYRHDAKWQAEKLRRRHVETFYILIIFDMTEKGSILT